MRHLISLLLLIFICSSINAQTIITGKLLDDQQRPINNVSVTYKKSGTSALSGFTKTDSQGKFELKIKQLDADSLQLDFNHMAYAKKSVIVVNATANYAYVLQQYARQIEEVKVGDIPVYKRKDTVNFNLGAFTSPQDRVIGDIIKKLPGIEMRGDQILYQGKPLQKYMVNNLDLMGGRYSMINKNLPVDAVKKVQVVENDQPIKILDSLVFSDRASLNIELKKFTSTGTGKIGTGLSPFLWDINLTPMTFGKTFQMLNSMQSNNVGYDASNDLRPFYTGGVYFSNQNNITEGPSYISLKNVSIPDFDEKKWLDNKIFLFSSNMLQKLKNGIEIKPNISYYDDSRQRKGFSATQYFTSDDIIINSERIDNRTRSNVLDAGVLIEKNENSIYLRNYLKYHKRWNADQGNILFNQNDNILQRRNYTDEALFNALSLAQYIGKQLVDIQSTLEYHNTPQALTVRPGQFQDIINAGMPYEEMKQNIVYKGLKWDNSMGFIRRLNRWTIAPKIGLNYASNNLQSNVMLHDNNETTLLGADYSNDMVNSSINLALAVRLGWEANKWKFNINMPYNVFAFNVKQQQVIQLERTPRNTFNPSTGLQYQLNANNDLSINIGANKTYGGLNDLYNAFIINQYRTMQRYNSRLLGSKNIHSGIHYSYRNTLKANFANLSYNYITGTKDYIQSTSLDGLGRMSMDIIDKNSNNYSHKLAGGVSRFFSGPKTVVKMSGSMTWSATDYLLNDIMTTQKSTNSAGTLEVINSLSSVVSGDFKTSIGQINNKMASGKTNKILYNNYFLNLVLYPSKNNSLSINNSLYGTNVPGQRDQFFIDATYRYTLNKWKTDIELTALNILNNNNYVQQISSNYELIQSYFELRPRQIMISTRFKF